MTGKTTTLRTALSPAVGEMAPRSPSTSASMAQTVTSAGLAEAGRREVALDDVGVTS